MDKMQALGEALDELEQVIKRSCSLPDDHAAAVAVWAAATHFQGRTEHGSLLEIHSQESPGGKTILLEILAEVCRKPAWRAGDEKLPLELLDDDHMRTQTVFVDDCPKDLKLRVSEGYAAVARTGKSSGSPAGDPGLRSIHIVLNDSSEEFGVCVQNDWPKLEKIRNRFKMCRGGQGTSNSRIVLKQKEHLGFGFPRLAPHQRAWATLVLLSRHAGDGDKWARRVESLSTRGMRKPH